ncbi:MAG TPA: alkaline phosphatase family protein [Terriglobales bacterium]|jgi:phospholipase C
MSSFKWIKLTLLSVVFAFAALLVGCQGIQPLPPGGGGGNAPTASLTASPTTVNAGQSTTLTWQTTNATTVTIDGGIGTVAASGSQQVTPTATTTYNLTATGAGGTMTASASVTLSPTSLQSINHIVFMLQENRSVDSYFGNLTQYWTAQGITNPPTFDGLPPNASNPSFDGTTTINAFHLKSVCFSDLSPSWNESHVDWNRDSPTSATALMNGYVLNSAKYARNNGDGDIEGLRSMGFYTDADLNFYYDMATKFATSDRWFSPVMSRTPPNRQYLMAATSAGHVYPSGPLTNKTIFQALEEAGISWKVYESDPNSSYLRGFQPFADQHATKIVDATQFAQDAANGALPAVAMIDGGYASGRDEHPNNNVQTGAAYVESFVKALMTSPSWKDSAFILTFDEGGGIYDHVPPQPALNPEGCTDTATTACGPIDLHPGDICSNPGTNCSFNYTGFRVPLIVISPFSKQNYVSHTVADFTAILKLIETRFGVQPLTKRDAAQIDMTEFFAFPNAPWAVPPTPVEQKTGSLCDFSQLQ